MNKSCISLSNSLLALLNASASKMCWSASTEAVSEFWRVVQIPPANSNFDHLKHVPHACNLKLLQNGTGLMSFCLFLYTLPTCPGGRHTCQLKLLKPTDLNCLLYLRIFNALSFITTPYRFKIKSWKWHFFLSSNWYCQWVNNIECPIIKCKDKGRNFNMNMLWKWFVNKISRWPSNKFLSPFRSPPINFSEAALYCCRGISKYCFC